MARKPNCRMYHTSAAKSPYSQRSQPSTNANTLPLPHRLQERALTYQLRTSPRAAVAGSSAMRPEKFQPDSKKKKGR